MTEYVACVTCKATIKCIMVKFNSQTKQALNNKTLKS